MGRENESRLSETPQQIKKKIFSRILLSSVIMRWRDKRFETGEIKKSRSELVGKSRSHARVVAAPSKYHLLLENFMVWFGGGEGSLSREDDV